MNERPNLLIIMCDQLHAGVLGPYGGPVATPNIDRLAANGVLFRDVTCPTPFCSPSRASIITGRYPHAHGIVSNVNLRDYPAIPAPPTQEGIKASDPTTEKLLNHSGYRTHHYGKWHLMDDDLPYYPDMFGEHHEYAENMAKIFEEIRKRPRDSWMDWYGWALPTEVSSSMKEALNALGDGWQGERLSEFIVKMGRLELGVEENFDYQVADKVIDRLGSLGEDPFMITCSFNYPHDPNLVPSPYYEEFSPDEIQLPVNFNQREGRFEEERSRRVVADLGEAGAREFMRIYYGCVRMVDDQVGRILAALDASDRSDNTIVVFTADHGDMVGGHGMVWKSTKSFYDEVTQVPLLIRYPGKIQPGRLEVAAGLVDLMPTLLDLVGHPIPDGVQGHSLAPYLLGERDPGDAPPYAYSERVDANPGNTRTLQPGTPGAFMVRGRGWKYVLYPDGEEFLYNLTDDPGETINLAANPDFTDRKSEMNRELESWLLRTDYPSEK